jgi:6-phosphogluconolactonase
VVDREVKVLPDANGVARAAAEVIERAARESIAVEDDFRLVLSGGSTPRLLHEHLADDPDRVDWGRTMVYFGDERCVPPDDPASNYRMARETLLDRVSPASVHRIRGEIDPSEAAALYENEIRGARLDVLLLGLGTDGHTLSLFPGTPDLETDFRLVAATTAPVEPALRVTLTLRAARAARRAVLLVTGEAKARALDRVLRSGRDPALPASLLEPASGGRLLWLVDEAAAGGRG